MPLRPASRQARRAESHDMAKTIAAETLKMTTREIREKEMRRDPRVFVTRVRFVGFGRNRDLMGFHGCLSVII